MERIEFSTPWSCNRKLENADKFFGLDNWETHAPQVCLLYYHPVGHSSFQQAEYSKFLHLSMVSRSNLRHILVLTTENHPQQFPSSLIPTVHVIAGFLIQLFCRSYHWLEAVLHDIFVTPYYTEEKENELQFEFLFYFGSWCRHHYSFFGRISRNRNVLK